MANAIKKENAFLSKLFDNINEQFFEGSLPSVVLTVQGEKAGSKNTFGWFSPNRWGEELHEINITAENFKRSPFSILITLHHEMIHLKNHIDGIKDYSRQGRYHNKHFATACQNHGLIAIPNEQIGYETPHDYENQSEEIRAFYDNMKNAEGWQEVENTLFQIQRGSNAKAPKQKKPPKWLKVNCLSCNEEFQILTAKVEKFASFFCPYCEEMHTIETKEENEEGEQ